MFTRMWRRWRRLLSLGISPAGKLEGDQLTVQLVPLIIFEAAFELQVQCDPDEEARMRNLPTKVKIYGIFQPCLVRLLAGLKLPVFTFLLNFFLLFILLKLLV